MGIAHSVLRNDDAAREPETALWSIMLILEVALQGIRGFPDVLRVPLKAGVNVQCGSVSNRGTTLVDALYHCIYPSTLNLDATAALGADGATQSRIAVTFFGRDAVSYRIVREAVTGSMKLYKFDNDAKKYRLFSNDTNEVAQYLRVQQQLPDEVTYERLFLYSSASMPSRGDAAKSRSGAGWVRATPAPSGPGLPEPRIASQAMSRSGSLSGGHPGSVDNEAGLNLTNALVQSELAGASATDPEHDWPTSLEEKKKLLKSMRRSLELVVRGLRAQAEIDALNARKFDLSERLGAVLELQSRYDQLVAARDVDRTFENMPPNLGERLRTFEEREARFRVDDEKIRDEIRRVEQEAEDDLILPLHKDRYFVGSITIAALLLVLAIVSSKSFIAVLNIPAAMVAVGAVFRYLSDLERGARRAVRFRAIEESLERLEQRRDLDTGAIRRLLEKLDIDSPSELQDQVERFETVEAEIERLASELAEVSRDPDADREREELQQIASRIQRLEVEVLSAAGTSEGEETLRRKVEALEQHLGPDVPPRVKSPPLGLPREKVSQSVALPPADSAGDLPVEFAAQSAFSSHTEALSLLTVLGEQPVVSNSTGASGAPEQFMAPSATHLTGDLLPHGPVDSKSDRPEVDAPHVAPPELASAPARAPSLGGARATPPLGLPKFPGPADSKSPLALGPRLGGSEPSTFGARSPSRAVVAPSGPGLPSAESGPVVPRPQVVEDSPFDFGGGFIGEEHDEEADNGPAHGGGTDGGSHMAGYLAAGLGHGGFGGGNVGHYGSGGAPPPDRSRELVQATADLLSVEVDKLAKKLSPRLDQYLSAFTSAKYSLAAFGPRGEVHVTLAGGGTRAFMELEGAILDKVDVALRFSLLEATLQRYSLPVIIQDPFVELDGRQRRGFGQMLGYFARASQVVVFSEMSDLPGEPFELD